MIRELVRTGLESWNEATNDKFPRLQPGDEIRLPPLDLGFNPLEDSGEFLVNAGRNRRTEQ